MTSLICNIPPSVRADPLNHGQLPSRVVPDELDTADTVLIAREPRRQARRRRGDRARVKLAVGGNARRLIHKGEVVCRQ